MNAAARNGLVQDYVDAFERLGPRALIANLQTKVSLHSWGEHLLPLTRNDGAAGETFVCSPRLTYVEYPLEELRRFPDPRVARALTFLVLAGSKAIGPARLDEVVHINNWMLSTNLPVPLDPALALTQTRVLAERYPRHLLSIRSLTRAHSPILMQALSAAGWVMLPSRQVFLLDDIAADALLRRDIRRDEQLRQRTPYRFEALDRMSPADAARIAELYGALYIGKYTSLNPAFTPAFVAISHEIGLLRYLVWRDLEGDIQAFGAMHVLGPHATMPMIGHNLARSPSEGLYRLAFYAGIRFAADRNLRFNLSSGAGAFKRHRGGRAEMEYTAFYLRHLPAGRRLSFTLLEQIATRVGGPVLRRYGL